VEEDECLDIVDENDKVIGREKRSVVYAKGLKNFRVVNIFIKNKKGELWIPRRSANKRIFPLCLDMSVGEHVQSGEEYETAFRRGLLEELNLNSKTYKWRLLGVLSPEKDKVSCFMGVYEIQSDVVPNYNKDDFVEWFWLRPEEILKRMKEGEKAKDDLPKLIKIFYIKKN